MKWNYYAISSSYAATASYALNASSANTGSLLLTASAYQNVITFTKGNGSVFSVTVATGSSISSAFPYTGSAQITGSLGITGSFSQQGSPNVFLKGLINQVNPTSHVVMLDNTTGQLYITASSALGGGGGGGGTPGGLTGQIQYNNAGAFGGVPVLTYNGITLTGTGSFSGSFTGILIGTASHASTASYVLNAVSSSFSITSSYSLYATNALSASFVDYNNIVEYSDLSRNTIASVKNVSGGTIPKGTPCYITSSGTSGNLIGIIPADASNPNLMPAGIINAQNLAAGAEGLGYIDGFINGVDTSAFNSGDEIFVAVGGGYTNIKPTGSALIQPLGYVEKVDVSNGSGLINGPGHFFEVPNITSGYIWVGNSNQVATPVSTASLFVSASISSSYALSSSFTTIALTASFAATSSFPWFQTSSNIAYIGGNVGVGTITPLYKLDVSGSGNFTNGLIVTGSTTLKGDFFVNSATTVDLSTNVLNVNAPLITVPTFATPYSPSVNVRTVMYDATSNALFVTSSLPGTGGGGTGLSNFISTGSITASVNTDVNNLFLVKSGSVDLLKINSEKVLITFTQSATPTPIIGGIFISSSGDLFFGI